MINFQYLPLNNESFFLNLSSADYETKMILAHEIGHQLGANHSFNSTQGANCSNGRSGEVAVEPGSGSSIMSYSGLCGSDNLINNPRDDYFHFASITQISNYTRFGSGANCGTNSTGSAPSANAGADVKIPANTPFLLDGTASGGTSSWDQIDIGSASAVDVDTGDNAIIRHNIPSSEQDRYIPTLADLFAGTTTKGEKLPSTSRELNFAYVVRNGGISSDKKFIDVTNVTIKSKGFSAFAQNNQSASEMAKFLGPNVQSIYKVTLFGSDSHTKKPVIVFSAAYAAGHIKVVSVTLILSFSAAYAAGHNDGLCSNFCLIFSAAYAAGHSRFHYFY